MRLPPTSTPVVFDSRLEPSAKCIEIFRAFVDLPDVRNTSSTRYQMALCLALFTLAVTAGIGDQLKSYRSDLITLFNAAK